jgi:hypothetical protein
MNAVSSLVVKCVGLPLFFFLGSAIIPAITFGQIKVDRKDYGIEHARHSRDFVYRRDGQLYMGSNTAQLIVILLVFILLVL